MEKPRRIFPWFEDGFFIPHKTVWICRVSCNSLSGFCPSQRGLVKKEWIFPEVWSPHILPISIKRAAPVWDLQSCHEQGKGCACGEGAGSFPAGLWGGWGWTQNLEGWKRRGRKCKYSEIWEWRSEIQPRSGDLEDELNTHENQEISGRGEEVKDTWNQEI